MTSRTIQHCTVDRKLDTDKFAKLVRLLGSHKDGEILAAVAALKRALGVAEMDLHDLANVVTAGFRKPENKRAVAKWAPPAPDTEYWSSMAWYAHYHGHRLPTTDRDYVHDVLLGRHFDCGRADAHMMRRLRGIVSRI